MEMLDLFAGAGGWEHAAHQLPEIDNILGIELEKYMCQTREANGLRTEQAEISLLDPNYYPSDILYDYNNHGWVKDDQFDKLTEEEGLRFQGFPEGFELCGSKHSRFTQIGNAIPVELAKVILEELISP